MEEVYKNVPTAARMILPVSHLNMVKVVIQTIIGTGNVQDPLPVTTIPSLFRMKATRLTFISRIR